MFERGRVFERGRSPLSFITPPLQPVISVVVSDVKGWRGDRGEVST